MTIRNVGIIGCGLIGESWAALCRVYGYEVTAWDPSPQSRKDFASRTKGPIAQLRKLLVDHPASPLGGLTVTATLEEAVAVADIIQENAPEKVALKRKLYADIVAAAPSHAILSSSTSSLTWSDLSAELDDPSRLITAHPFNPPHLMPLVELFAASPERLRIARDFYETMGREVVTLRKDAVGHIANRLASALWREAVSIVAEDIADVSSVDRALVHGPGLRWSVVGAHMAYHLGGGPGGMQHYLEHLGPSQEARWRTLGDPRLTPEVCTKLIDGVQAEAGQRSIPELEALRDDALMTVLKARSASHD